MKNKLLSLIIISTFLFSACGQKQAEWGEKTIVEPLSISSSDKQVDWGEKNIAEPLITISFDKEVVLGDLNKDEIKVDIPGNTFDEEKNVVITNPENAPAVSSKEITPIGAPVDISIGDHTRLNEPIKVVFKIKDNYKEDLRKGSIWISYFNGENWEYFKPKIDNENLTISFETYHLSLFAKGKISVEERLKNYVHTAALSKMAQDNVDEVVNKVVEQAVDHILKDKLGMNENSVKFKILSSLVNDDNYKEIIDSFKEGNVEDFNKKLMIFAGQKIAANVGESALQGALSKLSGDGVEIVEAVSEAAGYVAEGQYLEAGRILGEKVADSFMITQIVKGASEVVQYNIDLWKDGEIEAAYKAYKNGADGGYWGYNVDKEDFNAAWNQMKGISTRLQSEAVEKEIARRENIGKRPATDEELDQVRYKVRDELKKQFEERLKNEDEIAKQEERMKTLVDKFKEAKLLDEGSFGYNDAYDDMESRLDKLLHLTAKILRDTGRKDWTKGVFTNDKEISLGDMVSLMQTWYLEDGKEKYQKMLQDKFGIGLGEGISQNFTLAPVIEAPTNDYQSIISTNLFNATPIEIQNGSFSASYNTTFAITEFGGFNGSGNISISGNYNSLNGVIIGTYTYGWDGERSNSDKEVIIYAGNFESKVLKNDKNVSINYMGTITSTRTSMNKNGYGKPWITTNSGGPTKGYKIELF